MNVQPIRRQPAEVDAEWIALGVFEGQTEPPAAVRGTPLAELLALLLNNKDISGELGATTPLYGTWAMAAGAVLVFGLGPPEKFGAGEAYTAGVAVARRLSGKKRGDVAVALPEDRADPAVASALTEGLVVGVCGSGLRKTEPSRFSFETLQIVLPPGVPKQTEVSDAVTRGAIVGESVNLARELANTPPAEKPPSLLAARAREVATAAGGIVVDVWDRARIEHERFGGLIGVAAGSDEPPAFVTLDYRHGDDAPTLALVGKGVTFDSLDLATLTGACLVALGTKVAGLFANDESFAEDVNAACKATGERAWRLPLDDDYLELIKSQVADLKNVGGKWGGAITAAKFLQQFVGKTPWVHLDIAGPSWADTESATRDAGGTGCFVRTLVALVEASRRQDHPVN
ncbi:MAG: leucyl aminopeptidase [Planctomycetia bacterium]|nr:leucyl aminopeptidase [Planctomycetia bacterium]